MREIVILNSISLSCKVLIYANAGEVGSLFWIVLIWTDFGHGGSQLIVELGS